MDHDSVSHDGEEPYARAMGPMQFIPETWRLYGVDANNDGEVNVDNIDDAALSAKQRPDLLGGVTVITGRALGLYPGDDGRTVVTREKDFLAVPYNVWSNRGEERMAVWLPRRVSLDFDVP